MRQVVVGLLVVLVLWWSGSRWFGGDGAAAAGPGVVPPATPEDPATALPLDLSRVLDRAPQPAAATGALAARPETPPTPAPPTNPPAVDVDALLARLAGRETSSIGEAWHLLATQKLGDARDRVVAALRPAADDFATLLAALGSDNGFLHSTEGRSAAARVLAAGLGLPDADAVAAVSQLLGLCVRGRIEKSDYEVRAFVDDAYRQHRIRVDRWLCDPGNVARARSYTVAAGESLARIAARFRRDGVVIEDGTLAILNRIHNPNAVQAGQKIKIPVDPIFAVVEKRSFSMAVYVGEFLLRLYWVGHGENDRTPVTEFTVAEKQPQPEWTAPDGERYPYGHPKNILGEYFVKFRHERYTGFGAHGTPMPETICTMSSAGCVRMAAPDIAELFRLLPRGAKVVIRASESIR